LKFGFADDNLFAASWSETKAVHFWDLTLASRAVKSDRLVNSFASDREVPVCSFRGHPSDGFAMDWSNTQPGYFATGDCTKFIYVYQPAEGGKWEATPTPLVGHTNSVEDIQWSPTEANIFASCSVDRSLRIWDIRSNNSMLNVPNAHKSDVNVISWNPLDPVFLLSGGDDNAIKVWDMRQFSRTTGQAKPIATFTHHNRPITSVEWSPHDSTIFAASGEDNQITIWDLSVEKDESENMVKNERINSLPPQLLFIHQGQKEIKELHWHKQMPGFIISTALSGFDIFKTINV
jgi:ribosome assembly protein RRB1